MAPVTRTVVSEAGSARKGCAAGAGAGGEAAEEARSGPRPRRRVAVPGKERDRGAGRVDDDGVAVLVVGRRGDRRRAAMAVAAAAVLDGMREAERRATWTGRREIGGV